MIKSKKQESIVLKSIREGYNLTEAYFEVEVGKARSKKEIKTVLNLEQLTDSRFKNFYVETDKVRDADTIASLEEARRLADHLREDGINVWLDDRGFAGGEEFDENIINAIDKSAVFIPLISRNSRQFLTKDEKIKYHIKEWEWAYSRKIRSSDLTILPVKIDDTAWMYEIFKDSLFLKIPGGRRGGDYEKLREQLEEVQRRLKE